ncbi:hypothetical protein J5N97_008049 [Dioscorea zingiberensis]|uniref:Inner centromere protein ARK-binding domain-containing protein n=1 Tax=Dioscorea zingiberensis TaxID=325984 RepID=A0A9D5DF05_9LILI|nr:hypothetical protein J5N97_008049 [Dioscorea zingiberensis]
MSTMEHLFMQIFERRGWIHAQLRQQGESYSESLASNLLAHGCRPPPWLLASGSECSAGIDPKEMNREQLISGILFARPRFTTPSVNHSSLFTLPSVRGDNVSQSSSIFNGTCALDQAVPDDCPKDREQGSDVPVESQISDGYDGVDPLARVQRSRSRQRDLETRLRKKQRTAKHEVEMSSMGGDGFTGRMTRSMAAALKADHAKRELKPMNLLGADLDRRKVTRTRSQKLKSPDMLLKLEETSTVKEEGFPAAVGSLTNIHTVSSIITENFANNGNGAAIQSCAVGTEESDRIVTVSSPACSGLGIGNIAGSRMSDLKSIVEPKQLLFDVMEEHGLHGISTKGFEKVTQGIPDVMDFSKSEALHTVTEGLPFQDFSRGHDPSVTTQFQGEYALPAGEIMCTVDGSIGVSNKNLELEKFDFKDSECASHPSPGIDSLSYLCGSLSKPKCGTSESRLHCSAVGDSALNASNLQDTHRKGSLGCLVHSMTEPQHREIQGNSSKGILLKTDVLESAEEFIMQNSEAQNSSPTRWLHGDNLSHSGQIIHRMPAGEPAIKVRCGNKLLEVDDLESASHLTGHLDGLQVASGSSLECIEQSVSKESCSGSIGMVPSKPLEANVFAETVHFSSEVINGTTLEKEDNNSSHQIPLTMSEAVPIVEKKQCGSLETTDVFLENNQLVQVDTLHTTEVISCLEEADSSSHGCEHSDLHAKEDSECNCQTTIESRMAAQVLVMSSLTTISRAHENTSSDPFSSGGCLSNEDCLLDNHVDLSSHVMLLHDDRIERTMQSSVLNAQEECQERFIKRKTDSTVPQSTNSSLSNTSVPFETCQVLIDAEENRTIDIGEPRVMEPIITPVRGKTQNAVVKVMQFPRNSYTSDKSSSCTLNSSKRVDDNPMDFMEKHITGETSNGGDVPHLLPEACPLSRNSVNVEEEYGSCEMNAIQDKLTLCGTGSQNAPPRNRYFLRSLTSHVKNSGYCKSNETSVVSCVKPPLKATDDSCGITWPKRRKMDRSNNIFATSHRMRSKPLLHAKEGNDDIGKITAESDSITIMESVPLQLSGEAEAEIPGMALQGISEELCKVKKRRITKGGEGEITTLPFTCAPSVHSLVESFRGFRDSIKDEVDHNALENATLGQSVNLGKIYDSSLLDGKKILNTSDSAVFPPYDNDLFGGGESHETMPEFEGFSITVPSLMENGVVVDYSDFSGLTEKRTSLVERLCKSNSVLTPLSRPSAKYKINEIPDVYQSLPSGILLDHMKLSNSLEFHSVSMDQIRASRDANLTNLFSNLGPEFDSSLLGGSLSQSIPSSSRRFGSGVGKPPLTPPVGKISQRIISGRSFASSEKVGSNPELICFRIDENSCMTEENKHLCELEDTSEDKVGSGSGMVSNNRKALGDVTSRYQNAQSVVSGSTKSPEKGSLDSVCTELYFQTQMEVNPRYTDDGKCKAAEKENSFLLASGGSLQNPAESLSRMSGKPDLSVKGKERIAGHTILGKGGNPSNIVSNISSFIPLVRQKQQAAAPAAGKRDIKVKALEAAEAAKRLEEKRQNDRAMRKAAAKLERDRLEQENTRLLELQQKQKEEARKKKEADIAARKRQREDGERKEKEKKQRCMQETKKPQRLGGEKLLREKEEKRPLRKALEDKELRKKQLVEDEKRQNNVDTHKGVAGCGKASVVEPSITEVLGIDNRHASNSLEAHDSVKESNGVEQVRNNLDNIQNAIQDRMSITKASEDFQSYEISPYKDSDDEDGEEDTRRRMKRVPSWAREECLKQILLSNKHIDPMEFFSRKRFFNLSEVLTPRVLRQPLSQLRHLQSLRLEHLVRWPLLRLPLDRFDFLALN